MLLRFAKGKGYHGAPYRAGTVKLAHLMRDESSKLTKINKIENNTSKTYC